LGLLSTNGVCEFDQISPTDAVPNAEVPSTAFALLVSTNETFPVGAGDPAVTTEPATVAVNVKLGALPLSAIVVVVEFFPPALTVTLSADAVEELAVSFPVPRKTAL
jgi:hypothetical protein